MPEEQRFVLGIAYQAGADPRIRKGVDGGRDFFSKEELERACWSYMRSGCPQMNAFHVDGTEDCAEPVESFIWRWDDWDVGDGIVVKDGDWCLGAILSPRLWALHKAGKVNGLSPQGTARRRRIAKEDAVPIAKGSAADGDEDEFTELVDASFSKVALVGSGANGVPRFLISKEDGGSGLLPPDYVRDLIAKAEPEAPGGKEDTVTMTGSPAAIAKLMREGGLALARPANENSAEVAKAAAADAEYEAVVKAKYDTADRKRMASSGAAMKDGSYPIEDEEDLTRAIRAVGRGGGSHDAIRKHIMRRARSLGKTSEIPDDWNKDGSIKVSKADGTITDPELDGGRDGMDPTVPFTAPDSDDAPGDPSDPGSPAWEAIDAATAQKWLAIASRLKNALGLLAQREDLEAASADPGDAANAWDLEDAQCAVDFVIETLAVFAAGEQGEADMGADPGQVAKALAAFDPAPLEVIEGLAPVAKAGKVLSAANEAAIRGAAAELQKVLASLPEAPVAKEGIVPETTQAAEVAKETPEADMPQAETSAERAAASGQVPEMGSAPAGKKAKVAKAGKKRKNVTVYGQDGTALGRVRRAAVVAKADSDAKAPMQAVFDQKGDLIGVVDPAQIQPVAGAAPDKEPGATDAQGGGSQPQPAAAPAGDLQPQPSAAAGTPAAGVAKSGAEETTAAAPAAGKDGKPARGKPRRNKIAKAVKQAVRSSEAAHQEVVAKMAADRDALAADLAKVSERLETVEKNTVPPRAFVNGQVPRGPVPQPEHLRGHDQGAAAPVDVAKASELKRTLYTGSAAEQNKAFGEMQEMAVAGLQALHAAGPGAAR